jgi:glycosyltransferase involved in cell wall biosynthesis
VCVVGPGKRFLNDVTYSTYALAEALAARYPTSAVLLRELVPRRFFQGAARVGSDLSHLRLPAAVRRFEGIDWFWIPSLPRALWYLRRQPPSVLLVEYWTPATVHTQLALASCARRLGAGVVIEFHQVARQERSRAVARWWSSALSARLFQIAERFIVHTEHDRDVLTHRHGLAEHEIDVIPHSVNDHYHLGDRIRRAPEDCCNILCFGTIRPWKGVEDLVEAFDAIPPDRIGRYWLTIVGETWEGWTEVGERIARSPYRDRITFVNRWITDEEVDGYFAGADLVVVPHRSPAAKTPAYIAMSYGIPVVVTPVGGLPEVAERQEGSVVVARTGPSALLDGIERAALGLTRVPAILDGADDVCDRYEPTLVAAGLRVTRLARR